MTCDRLPQLQSMKLLNLKSLDNFCPPKVMWLRLAKVLSQGAPPHFRASYSALHLPLRLSFAKRVHKQLPQVSVCAACCVHYSALFSAIRLTIISLLAQLNTQSVSCSRLKCPDGQGEKTSLEREDSSKPRHILIEKAAVPVFSTETISTIVTGNF